MKLKTIMKTHKKIIYRVKNIETNKKNKFLNMS